MLIARICSISILVIGIRFSVAAADRLHFIDLVVGERSTHPIPTLSSQTVQRIIIVVMSANHPGTIFVSDASQPAEIIVRVDGLHY